VTATSAATSTPPPSTPDPAGSRIETLVAVTALALLAVLVGVVGLVWAVTRLRAGS
jgi:hypothetical protein